MEENLIDRYGRFKVHQVVADFYDHVLSSPTLSRYFDDIDIQGLVQHQTAFLRAVMGGPPAQGEPEIQHAHRRLGISEDDFDEMIRLLVRSLDRYGFEPEDVEMISQRYRSYQGAVVGGAV